MLKFKQVSFESLELNKLYLIESYMRKRCRSEKGVVYKKSSIPDFILCKIGENIYHVDNSSVFYEMVPQKYAIQEAMELRAMNLILKSITGDNYISL